MIHIDIVGIADVDRIWTKVAADVARCLRKAPMEIGAGDIWANCRSGQWFLIVAHDGETIHGTTVWRFTANGYFECVLLAGDRLKDWFSDLITTATTIATTHGCRGLVATGRPALIREIQKILPRAKVVRHTFASEF